MNKVNLSLQEKQLKVFIDNDRIRTFKIKLGFWKTCICLCEQANFSMLKDISDETSGNFTIFFYQFFDIV